MPSPRILLGGLFHETHTFLDGVTPLADFRLREGDEILAAKGDGSPLSGALEVAAEHNWEVIPTIDLRATPSATVADEVVEQFWTRFQSVYEWERDAGIDGIQLILHGAMATESFRDVEGEIITRIRKLPGAAELPICGVLDLHGNLSAACIEQTQGLIAYRRNPHTDSHAASTAGAELMQRILSTQQQPVSVWAQPAVMWPPTGTGTADDPMKTLEAMAREIEDSDAEIVAVNVLAGFSFADTPTTGVGFSIVTFGDIAKARGHLNRLCDYAIENCKVGNRVDMPLADARPRIREDIAAGRIPVVLVEPADNIGGGAPGDATTLLRTFLQEGFENAAVVINDPDAVGLLRNAAIGDKITLTVGGRGSRLTDGPVTLTDAELLHRSDGQFELEDHNSHLASMAGVHINMGPSAVVECGGVRVLLTTRKTPPFDLGQLRSQGIEPESCSVIGVKAAVAHRRAYDKITATTYTVDTPGPCRSDLSTFPFQHIRRPIFPLDER